MMIFLSGGEAEMIDGVGWIRNSEPELGGAGRTLELGKGAGRWRCGGGLQREIRQAKQG